MKYSIINIFQTSEKREMISRFCKASRQKLFAPGKMPEEYKQGVIFLEESLLPTTHISKKHILEALSAFAKCEAQNDIYNKIVSKIGKIICFYLLSNQQAMQIEIESLSLIPMPKRVNMKGVGLRVWKGTLIVTGAAVSLYNQAAGITIKEAGLRMYEPEVMVKDLKCQNIIDAVRSIDFNVLLQKIS